MIRVTLLLLCLALPARAQEVVRAFGPENALTRLTLRTTTDVDILAPTVEEFLATHPGLALDYEQWGSNALYQRSVEDCAAGESGADIVISSAVHQMIKLVNDRCAASWQSSYRSGLPDTLRWRDEIWGVTREPAVMVYNRSLVPPDQVPRTRFDLLDLLRPEDSRYAGRVATYEISQSGLGYLFAYMDSQEATTFGALMEAFARSGAVATCCSAEIIDGVQRGDYLIAYNILGSYAVTEAQRDPNLGIVAPRDYTLVLSRALIFPGQSVGPEAGAFLDFLLSPAGQLSLAANNLAISAENPALSIEADAPDSARRLIPLAPALLVAMDRAKSEYFLSEWRKTFDQ